MVRTGKGTIPTGVDLYYIAAPTVGATSMVEVSLTSDPGEIAGGATFECIHKNPGYGFTIELSNAPQNNTDFDYLIS